MNQELRKVIEQNIERANELAADPNWLDRMLEEDGDEPVKEWDCPPVPQIAAGLRAGFSDPEEDWARRSHDFQRIVCLYWQVRPPSFWMLARYVAEGGRFPFATAMSMHLEEGAGEESRLALDAAFTRKLASVLEKTAGMRAAWLRLRDRMLTWEEGSRRFLTEFPVPHLSGADVDAEPFEQGEEFADGLNVLLTEVRTSRLQVTASRPAESSQPETLHLTFMGEKGDDLPAQIPLQQSGEFSVGSTDIDKFDNIRERLGSNCLVVLSSEPFPNLEE